MTALQAAYSSPVLEFHARAQAAPGSRGRLVTSGGSSRTTGAENRPPFTVPNAALSPNGLTAIFTMPLQHTTQKLLAHCQTNSPAEPHLRC